MNKKLIIVILGLVILVLGAALILWPRLPNSYSDRMESMTVAYSPFESCTLFLVAEDLQFFTRNGLDLTLYRSDSGSAALDDMLNGKADLAVSVAEFPLAGKVIQGTPARAIASIDKAEFIHIVARKDRKKGILRTSGENGLERPGDPSPNSTWADFSRSTALECRTSIM